MTSPSPVSAIKVFGYLEKPVFHELARHLQTRRLVAGDTLDLSKDKSFYIVVDGRVEVYARTAKEGQEAEDEAAADFFDEEEEGGGAEAKGWQLLNCVESGGTLSSLFTILSLFTEDVKLRYEEDVEDPTAAGRNGDVDSFDLNDVPTSRKSSGGAPSRPHFPGYSRNNSHRLGVPKESDEDEEELADESSAGNSDAGHPFSPADDPLAPSDSRSNAATPGIRSPSGSDGGFFSTSQSSTTRAPSSRPSLSQSASRRAPPPRRPQPQRKSTNMLGGGGLGRTQEVTLARAAEDTTLAVIPAEAFRRLTKKFPNAAACVPFLLFLSFSFLPFFTQSHRPSHPHPSPTRHLPHRSQIPRPHPRSHPH